MPGGFALSARLGGTGPTTAQHLRTEMTTVNVSLVCRIFCLALVNGLFGLVWCSDCAPVRSQAPANPVSFRSGEEHSVEETHDLMGCDAFPLCPVESAVAARSDDSRGWRDFADAHRPILRSLAAMMSRLAARVGTVRHAFGPTIPGPPEPGIGLEGIPIDLPGHSPLEALLVPAHDWSARLDLISSATGQWIPMEPNEMFAASPTQDELREERLLRKLTALASMTGEHAARAVATARTAVESTIELSVQWQDQAARILRDEDLAESPTTAVRAERTPVSRR